MMFEVAREKIDERRVAVRGRCEPLSIAVEVVEPVREDCVRLHRTRHRHPPQGPTNTSTDDCPTLDAKHRDLSQVYGLFEFQSSLSFSSSGNSRYLLKQ